MKRVLRSLFTVSGLTFVSRVFGFLRDVIIARIFGASHETDAFFVAFRIPNLLRRLLAEGAFSQAFVPLLIRYKSEGNQEKAWDFLGKVTRLWLLLTASVSLLGIIGAPYILRLAAPGLKDFELASGLLSLTSPYLFFVCMAALCSAILHVWGRFAIAALLPILLNLSLIVCALLMSTHLGIFSLGYGVLLAGILQLLLIAATLWYHGLLPKLFGSIWGSDVIQFLRKMLTALLGVSVVQLGLLLNTVFASFLVAGSVSWIYYADRLIEFPSGVIGVALATVLLPELSREFSQKNFSRYGAVLSWGLQWVLILVAPACLALILLREALVVTLFQYGAFALNDVTKTAQALWGYSLGLLPLVSIKVLASAFYARGNLKFPVWTAMISLALVQALNLMLLPWLSHIVLCISVSIGASCNALMLWYGLARRYQLLRWQSSWLIVGARLSIALLALAIFLVITRGSLEQWAELSLIWRGLKMLAICIGGAGCYFLALKVLRVRLPGELLERDAM